MSVMYIQTFLKQNMDGIHRISAISKSLKYFKLYVYFKGYGYYIIYIIYAVG